MERHVIIGNSIAAVGCIEGIRKAEAIAHKSPSSITVIGEENHSVYARPLISYLLEGKTDEERMAYRPNDFYSKNGVTLLTGKRATAIDQEQHAVIVDHETSIPYDDVLVATGSKPFVPPMNGLEQVSNKYCFMTLNDAHALQAALDQQPGSRVLIVGAGLIGLKCAEGIAHRCASITCIDLAPRILPSILNEECAAIMQAHLEMSLGLQFILGDSVAQFESQKAITKNGEVIPFDILVMAVGVRANIELVKDIGGETNRGIVIDDTCQTSVPNVYAAGDCAEGMDVSIGQKRVLAILPNAYMQGYTAGMNMAGEKTNFNNAFPMNAIGFAGLHVLTAGDYQGECRKYVDGENYKALYVRDNRLVGFMLMGETANAGIYTSLIREQTPIDSLNFEMMVKAPQLAAFSKEERQEKLKNRAQS